ncbi:MAG TPA: UDP-N-acetylmuramate--L-alanine ligase [Lachnospiraceae bacterium]|nr:UDP-N-acetylmuramate--L-alanine ligase [Lachnospiraceae bacterium]
MKLDFENTYKNIYFIGIGGISMSGLAEILNFKGIHVSGSDVKASDVTSHLESIGIKVNFGHKAENITDDIDLVIFTAAVKQDNPEIVAAKAKGIWVIERSDLLGSIMSCYSQSIAVAGTHGKTTTTSMLSEVLLADNADPTISVGGMLSTIGGNTKIGNSEFFLAEACEYHDSFLKFNPFVAIILNVEAEHLDYFKDLHQIQTSFKGFASNAPSTGFVIINNATVGKDYITDGLKAKVITYGLDSTANWYAHNIIHEPNGRNSFDAVFNGKVMGRIALRIPGEHNILNALAACAAAYAITIPMESIITGLDNYSGVNRRFQYKGTYNGISIIDDYAHHPTEIRATLAAAQKVEHKKLWCVFQPHTYSRAKALFEDFGNAFTDADEIIVTDIYAAREKDTGLVHARDIADKIKSNGKSARYIGSFNDIVDFIKSTAQPGDMLITMGAGDVYSVGESLIGE